MAFAVGNALPSFVKEEDERAEHQAEEEGDEEEEQMLSTRGALQPAGPSTAGQECSVWTGTRAVEQSPCTEAVARAAGRSPSTRAATRAAEQACKSDTEVLPDEMRRSIKRKRAAASLQTEAVAAVATAAYANDATAEESKPMPDSRHPVTHRNHMQTEQSALVKGESPSPQNASLLLSRAHVQHKISDPAELIVISDSEEENAASTHSSETTPTAHPNANAKFTPAQAHTLDPTHTPTHTPMATHRIVTGMPQAPNTGSASDPIVIELTESEDDDQVSVSAQNQPKSWLGSPQNQSTITPRQLRAALRKPNSESLLASPDDFFLSLSDNSPTPGKAPSTAKGCRSAQTTQTPLAHPSKGSLAPLSGSVKGSPCPISQSMKGTPATPQALPSVSTGKLPDSIRSAARNKALLSVPRRGRTNGTVTPPPDPMAILGNPPDRMATSGNPPDPMATSGNPPDPMATSGKLHGTASSCMHRMLASVR